MVSTVFESNHIKTHQVRVPGLEHWGYMSMCGKQVENGHTVPKDGVCHDCLRSFIMKKQDEIEKYKLFFEED
jgi:hypothetical protein